MSIKRAITGICVVLGMVLTYLLVVPFAPNFPDLNLDSSWQYASNVASSTKMAFGRDFIFASGPLSSVYTHQFFPTLFKTTLVAAFFITSGLWAGFWMVARGRRASLLALPILISQIVLADALFLFIPLLLLIVVCTVEPRKWRLVASLCLVLACALLPSIKASFGIAVLPIAGLWLIGPARRRPTEALAASVLFVSFWIGSWLLIGQSLGSLADYLRSTPDIVLGYTNAMSSDGPAWQLAVFFAAAAMMLALGAIAFPRHKAILTAGLASTILLAFKAGFVRQDGHVMIAAATLLLAGYLLALIGGRAVAAMAMTTGLVAWLVLAAPYVPIDIGTDADRLAQALRRPLDTLADLAQGKHPYAERFAAAEAAIRAQHVLASGPGTADLYPSDAAALLATGAAWNPRPVVQSYSAYTPRLAMLNAAHLTGETPPDTIYFAVSPLDDRYPALEDSASWPILVSRYVPQKATATYLTLARKQGAADTVVDSPVVDTSIALGESVAVPAGPIWARIAVKPSLLGGFVSMVYKLPLLRIVLDYPDGGQATYRLIPGIAEGGFLLSPTINGLRSFVALGSSFDEDVNRSRFPVRLTVTADDDAAGLWGRDFHVTLAPIQFPVSSEADAMLVTEPHPQKEDDIAGQGGDCVFDEVGASPDSPLDLAGQNTLHVRGWAMLSAKDGKVNQGLMLSFVPVGGGIPLVADLAHTPRPDVATYLHHPDLTQVGYDTDIDVRALDGSYRLQLLQRSDEGLLACPHRPVEVRH